MMLQATLILEILGRPKEYIVEGLNKLVSTMENEKGIKVVEKKIHETTNVKDAEDLYTTFAELLVYFDNLEIYFDIIFRYMPSHIELIEPQKILLNNVDFNDLANRLILRLYDYDAITKKALYEREVALAKLKEVAPEMVIDKRPVEEQKTLHKKEKKKRKN